MMITTTTTEYREQLVRSCFKCGVDFEANAAERVCGTCRIPKNQSRTTLTPHLSFREVQVVILVADSLLNKEIAFELHLTEGTIKEYLNRIFKKLSIGNRVALAVWWVKNKQSYGY